MVRGAGGENEPLQQVPTYIVSYQQAGGPTGRGSLGSECPWDYSKFPICTGLH